MINSHRVDVIRFNYHVRKVRFLMRTPHTNALDLVQVMMMMMMINYTL